MKVLIYAHAFAPKIGGAETYVMLLARGLAGQTGVEVTVATDTPAGNFDDGSLPFNVVRQPRLRGLWRLIGAADIVQLAGPCLAPLTLSLLRRKAVAVEHHTYQAVCPNGLLYYHPGDEVCPGHFLAGRYRMCLRCNRIGNGWYKSARLLLLAFPRLWMCRHVVANIAVSHHVARRLQLPSIVTIPHGIPDPGPNNARRMDAHHVPSFAFVGRLVREKGLPVMLEAARHLKDEGFAFRLRLIGDGPERALLEQAVWSLGLTSHVEFTGYLTGDALESALGESTAVIIPSKWEELAPLVAIENLMRGRVLIVAEIGGLAEEVGDGGLKFPPGDARSLAECMKRVIHDPALREAVSAKGRRRAVEMYLHDRMIQDHLRVYSKLCQAH